jgi:hypothetical protein
MLLKSEGGGEEVVDLDGETDESKNTTTTTATRRRRRRQKTASPEPSNRESRAAWTQIPTGGTEKKPGEDHRRAGNRAHHRRR